MSSETQGANELITNCKQLKFIKRASTLKLLQKTTDEFVSPAATQIVSTPLTQIGHTAYKNRSMSPTMVSKYEEQLKVGSVLQRSLEEFVGFVEDK